MEVIDILEANLPEPCAENTDQVYNVIGEFGNILKKSNGYSMISLGKGSWEGDIFWSRWQALQPSSLGECRRLLNVGNNLLATVQWNGIRWVPFGGKQLIYDLQEVQVSSASLTPQIVFPEVTIFGGMMGESGSLEIEATVALANGVDAVSRSISVSLGGEDVMADTTSNRRAIFHRSIKNLTSTSQVTFQKLAGQFSEEVSDDSDLPAFSINTSQDQLLNGGCQFVVSSTATARLLNYKVWLLGS